MHLSMHFGTILSQSKRPTRPMVQFEAHFVCQHTDFDMRTHSFVPLAITAVMRVFRKFVEGSSECGAEAMVEKKLEDVHIVQPTTTSRKQSKYSTFW